jgi:hypothetical protein
MHKYEVTWKRYIGFGQPPNSPIIKETKPAVIAEIASLSGPSFDVDRTVYTAPINWMVACSKQCKSNHLKTQRQPLEIKSVG